MDVTAVVQEDVDSAFTGVSAWVSALSTRGQGRTNTGRRLANQVQGRVDKHPCHVHVQGKQARYMGVTERPSNPAKRISQASAHPSVSSGSDGAPGGHLVFNAGSKGPAVLPAMT